MLVAIPSGRDRFAPDLETIYENFKHSYISQYSVSKMKKTCKLFIKDVCSTCVIEIAHATYTTNGHACCAPELPATSSSFETLCIEVIALGVLLQTAYALLNDQHAYSSTPASFPSQYPGWLNGYLKTHYVHGLNHLNLNNPKAVTRQDHTSSSYLASSSQLGHSNAQDNRPPRIQATDTEQALQLHVRSDTGHLCIILNMHGSPPLRILLSHYCGTRSDPLWRKKEQTYVQCECRWNQCPDCLYYPSHNSNNLDQDRRITNEDKSISNESHDFRPVPLEDGEGFISKEMVLLWKQQGSETALDLKDEQGGFGQGFSLDTAGLQEHKTSGLVKDIRMDRNHSIQFAMLKQSNGDDVDFISIQQGDGSEANRPEQKRNTHQQHGHSNGYSVCKGKRSIGSADFQDNDDLNGSDKGGDGDDGPQASGKKRVKYDEKSRFACPFFKHDPDRYKVKRSCCGPGWVNAQRVKEHIFRRHRTPEYECPRCHKDFMIGSAFDNHLRDVEPCELRDQENLPGASQEAIRLLRSRSNKIKKPLTEEEKWCNIYRILFPNDAPVPSPYYDEKVPESTNLFERSVIANFEVDVRKRLIEEPCLSNLVEFTSPNMVERITRVALDALPETEVQRSPVENLQTTLADGMANLGARQDAETEDMSSNPQTDLTACGTWSENGTEGIQRIQPSTHTYSWPSNSSGYTSQSPSAIFDFRVPILPRNDWTESNNLEPIVVFSGDSTYGSAPSESLDRHNLDDLKEWTAEGSMVFFNSSHLR
ncbi:hypothetical protein F53441_14111 [Fusarium austroafricanum]|uniref:C2H2-type domain-containing protein n=1 Tax=Fusarium austroafricanum TaxID=2364996 RepID=A0A8H4JKP8_9HYPO|nr:hypothetical protein F53441_14111 [Fusarium austroafricanum]